MIKNFTFKKNDNYSTPFEAWELIFKYIKCRDKVWCPFYNDGNLSLHLDKLKINYIHINKDFFTYEPDDWSCVIDNPPYSNKQQVIERLELLKKPYAILIPIDSLERKYMNKILKNKLDYTIIIPSIRYSFKEGKVTPPFKTVWFCVGFGLGDKIIFD